MKKRKKIIIFTLILLMFMGGRILLRCIFVTKGEILKNVEYKSNNLIVHTAKQGEKENLVILGSGYSLSINEQKQIVNHDPLMIFPSMKEYQEDTTVMSIFYPFECEGLEESGKELSDFINSKIEEYNEIILIGHSKCGVCFANAAKRINPKVNIVTISAPFAGTPVADRKAMLKKCNWLEGKIFEFIFSNHEVDKDIRPNSEFIKNADYSGLEYHRNINIISTCPQKISNPLDMILVYVDKKGVSGDGIVPKASQKLLIEGTIQEEFEATHATSLEKSMEIIKKYFPRL